MRLTELHSQKRQVRIIAIDRLVADAATRGDCEDRLYWTLIYDFEHAPMTTNLVQLQEAGINPVCAFLLNEDELIEALGQVIATLGDLGIFLLHTNHLTDRELYARLVDFILVEPVRDLPPDAGVHEFIDLIGGGGATERELFQRHYATPSERAQFREERGYSVAQEAPVSDRDCRLPKPARTADN
ncbi:MAG: hypothetical protein EXS17_07430 [Phycisphaerales bacterium]|nr:hypothetical protein [Phycisphaerales bacterium]